MLMNQAEYLETISTVKSEIKSAQYRAVLGANRELITLYWRIGQIIQTHKRWGNKFVENLAADIKLEFPHATGYSVRNLKYMAKFADTNPDMGFVQTVSAQIPWSHHVAILDKVKDADQRVWYIENAGKNGAGAETGQNDNGQRRHDGNLSVVSLLRNGWSCGIILYERVCAQ